VALAFDGNGLLAALEGVLVQDDWMDRWMDVVMRYGGGSFM